MNDLNGQVVLVTGAAKRIGRSIARALAGKGAQVAVHYNHSRDEAEETARAARAELFQADLTKVREIQKLFEDIDQCYGRLDCLVNNAARYRAMDALSVTEEDWDSIIDMNLKGTFFCCQQGAKLMLRNGGGRIVNISSLGGLCPWSRHVPYGASKAGVIMLTRSLSKALAPRVTVNSVAPGVIHFGDEIPDDIARLIEATPMKRHGTGEEIAEVVLQFLTGPDFVTGQVIAVDGGLSQR